MVNRGIQGIVVNTGLTPSLRCIETQATPNPNAMKFVLDRVAFEKMLSFRGAEEAKGFVLAERLFEIPGVVGLLFVNDFVTVSKSPDVPWRKISAVVRRTLSHGVSSSDQR